MIQIAHISDLHFGNSFCKATWNAVANIVIKFNPDLIVVSGDLVDDPSPAHLLAAKCALSDLSHRARENSKSRGKIRLAELVVVPGNHDVFESGVAVGMPRLNWFERIFYGDDTTKAETALKNKLQVNELGFCTDCSGIRPQGAGWIEKLVARWCSLLSARTTAPWNRANDFTNHIGTPGTLPRVRMPEHSPILFALLDSNPSNAGLYAATGVVGNDQLIGLQAELAGAGRPFLARVAVVHHHVLPIAFTSGAARATGEPMMVLRNAGAVLRILADHKFDLILHGHWHKSQFARIDFGSDETDSYPIAVVSAGSAAIASRDNPSTNSINLITIGDTGRITVKSLYYGAAQAPNPEGKQGHHYNIYKEPLSATKRRAHARARDRHFIECAERQLSCEITENGDLWVAHRFEDLQIHDPLQTYRRRPFGVYVPPHGHFVRDTLRLDDSSHAGITLSRALSQPELQAGVFEYYWINFPGNGLVPGGEPANFGVQHGCANCMKMTHWEAQQRAKKFSDPPAGFDNEWVGALIYFPTRKLVLRLKLPRSLATTQPYVACRRAPKYPDYEIDDWGDAILNPKDMLIDSETQDEEKQGLFYEAPTCTWILEIDRPLVGYLYSLRWLVPKDEPDRQITGDSLELQRVLLRFGRRIENGTTRTSDNEALRQFDLLYDGLQREVCNGGPDERWIISLFIYDSEQLALRSVLSRLSWTTESLPRNFEIPFGDGVSGAAFQQRRSVAWNRQLATGLPAKWGSSLINPVSFPDLPDGTIEIVNMLSLPVYHRDMEDLRRPPPGATIGVVTICSSSYASPINGMDDDRLRRLRSGLQAQMNCIRDILWDRTGAASPN